MRDQIDTPALLVDIDALSRNVARMADLAKENGFVVRPHVKTHKCAEIARMQIEAGAIGVCCQTLAEARAMADADIPGILIACPQPAQHQLIHVAELLSRGADITMVVDSEENVHRLQAIASEAKRVLPIIIDYDMAVGRAGVFSEAEAVSIAKLIKNCSHLHFAGVQGYYGNLQQVQPFNNRFEKANAQAKRLRALVQKLKNENLDVEIVTGGGTGTFMMDSRMDLFTELQPGSYIFLDSCYGPLALSEEGNPFEYSLFVATSVVSVNRPNGVIVNAGFKAFATDSGLPKVARGAHQSGIYKYMGDEHGALDFAGEEKPALGSIVEFIPSHVDPTVNHFDSYTLVQGEKIVGKWNLSTHRYGFMP